MTKYKYFGYLCRLADDANVLYRNSKERWLSVWKEEDLAWCIEKGFMEESAPMLNYGENPAWSYYAMTKKGKRLAEWYTYPTWFYIKYKILHWHYIKYKVLYKVFPFLKH